MFPQLASDFQHDFQSPNIALFYLNQHITGDCYSGFYNLPSSPVLCFTFLPCCFLHYTVKCAKHLSNRKQHFSEDFN
jgi:hypothetical protein